jgi:hypothetical protein
MLRVLLIACTILLSSCVKQEASVDTHKQIDDLHALIEKYKSLTSESSTCDQPDTEYYDMPCRFTLTKKSMTLTFLPRSEFDVELPPTSASFSTLGFARISHDPCELVIALDDIKIISDPRTGEARWESFDVGNNIAHEILHCYTGAWHPSYPWAMEFAKKRKLSRLLKKFDADPNEFTFLWLHSPVYQPFEIDHVPRGEYVHLRR